MMEWRKTFLPFYEVSEYGDLRLLTNRSNRLAGTILTGSVRAGGYKEYHVRWKGKEHHLGAHRLVLLAFIGEPPTPDHECAHWDGDPTNNHYSNLRWATSAE
jgi:guanyl-specific ribonuclease Sa